MNKQAVVVEIATELSRVHRAGQDRRAITPSLSAEALYDRIAPLMRGEFPEDRARDILSRFRVLSIQNTKESKGYLRITNECLTDFMHLWEGHTSKLDEIVSNIPPEKRKALDEKVDKAIRPTEGDFMLEQGEPMTSDGRSDKELYDGPPTKRRFSFAEIQEKLRQKTKPKDTCQTCGGTKKICNANCPEIFGARLCEKCGQVEIEDCPDCTREERKDNGPRDPHEGYTADERSGGERRMVSRRDLIMERRCNPDSGRHYAQRFVDRRRTRTRRKAASDSG